MRILSANILLDTSLLGRGLRHYMWTDKWRQEACSLSGMVVRVLFPAFSAHGAKFHDSISLLWVFPQTNICYPLFWALVGFLNYDYILALIVRLFSILCGRILLLSLEQPRIITSRYHGGKFFPNIFCKGRVKKQSFKSLTVIVYSLGDRESKGIPGCKEPIGWIILFVTLRSVNILNFPDFLLITNTKEFKGLIILQHVQHLADPETTVLKHVAFILS